jgi:hypothetical protein
MENGEWQRQGRRDAEITARQAALFVHPAGLRQSFLDRKLFLV